MKNIVMATCLCIAFGMAAFAQSSPNATSQSAPSMQPQNSPSSPSNGVSNGGMNTGDQGTPPEAMKSGKGDKKIKGCIRSEGGKYMLEEKKGKEIALSGSEDFASHVGHMVTVHGMWAKGSDMSSGSSANSSDAGMSGIGGPFMVTKLEMNSGNCKTDSKMDKSSSNYPDNSNGKPSPNHK